MKKWVVAKHSLFTEVPLPMRGKEGCPCTEVQRRARCSFVLNPKTVHI